MKKLSKRLSSAIIPMILIAFVFSCQTPGEMKTGQGPPQYAHPEAIASTDWLQTHLGDINIRVVDCSVSFINPNSYNVGHIPGAVSLEVIGQIRHRQWYNGCCLRCIRWPLVCETMVGIDVLWAQ